MKVKESRLIILALPQGGYLVRRHAAEQYSQHDEIAAFDDVERMLEFVRENMKPLLEEENDRRTA